MGANHKPKFKTSRRQVAFAVHRFLVMLDQRMNEKPDDSDDRYFRMPDDRHFDELVAQLQKLRKDGGSIHAVDLPMKEMLLESAVAVRSLMGMRRAGR